VAVDSHTAGDNGEMNQYRKRKLALLAEDPHCFWCGVEVADYVPREYDSHRPRHMATIDHIYSRVHPHRVSGGRGKWVLACYPCNHTRGIHERTSDRVGTWKSSRFVEAIGGTKT
jgi:hypothetical protein